MLLYSQDTGGTVTDEGEFNGLLTTSTAVGV